MIDNKFWNAAASALAGRASPCEIAVDGQEFVRWAATEGLAGLLLRASPAREEWDVFRDDLHQAALR